LRLVPARRSAPVSCTAHVARPRRWLFRGAYSCGEALARGEKPWLAHNHDPPYITYCMNLVRMMLDLGVVPVVVLDGDRLPAKALTLDKRREARTTNTNRAHDAAQEGDQQAAARFMQRSYSVRVDSLPPLTPLKVAPHRPHRHRPAAPPA
jgi:hypothetical protein